MAVALGNRSAVFSGRLARFLARLSAELPASAAVALVADGDAVRWAAAGTLAPGDARPPDLHSRFDLASLTKPLVATLALRLDAAGRLPLTTRIGDLAAAAHLRLARRRLASLLRHRAGLVAWTPLGLRCGGAEQAHDLLVTGGPGGVLLDAEPGTYSDLGSMLWAGLAERSLGSRLDELLARWVIGPLGLESVAASPGPEPDVVACRLDNAVEVHLAAEQGLGLAPDATLRRGEVQDGNARFLGGLAGHAGLFGSAADLLALARAWMAPDARYLDPASVDQALAGRGPYALGWARRRLRGSAGQSLPASAFGHTGFTGTSLWIDPSACRIFMLLAHRCRSDSDMNAWRRRFHDSFSASQPR